MKPRRNKNHNQHHKNQHEGKNKDSLGPNQLQRETEMAVQSEGIMGKQFLSGKLFFLLS